MLVYHGHHLIPPMVENVFRIRTQNQRLRRTKFTICSVDREFIYDRIQSQNVRPTGSCFKRLIHCIALVFWQIRIDGSHASTCFFWIESFRFISNFSPLSQISHFSSPSTDIATSPLISIPHFVTFLQKRRWKFSNHQEAPSNQGGIYFDTPQRWPPKWPPPGPRKIKPNLHRHFRKKTDTMRQFSPKNYQNDPPHFDPQICIDIQKFYD